MVVLGLVGVLVLKTKISRISYILNDDKGTNLNLDKTTS